MRFYDTLLEALSELGEGVAVLEGESFLYVNSALPQMLGYEVRDMVGPGFTVSQLFAPEVVPAMAERLRERFSGERREDHYETVLLRQDGARVVVEISIKPLRHADASLRFAVIRDITQRRRDEEELRRAREAIAKSEKLAALGSLVSGVAHEVRTPLVYIQNAAVVLRSRIERIAARTADARSIEEALAATRDLEEGVERMNRLVRDLARYTRLPANAMQTGTLDSVVGDALRLWRATNPGIGIEVNTSLAPTPPLRLDCAKIQQLVINLIENAAEAMPAGGRVLVRTEAAPNGARLVVTDQGVGISDDVQARMFEPLFSTKNESMGLGLSIVRRIVEMHRGTIECASSLGSGTTFVVTLPA